MPVETRIRIEQDDSPESPREWDNLGTMLCWHGRYELGDDQPTADPTETREQLVENLRSGFIEKIAARADQLFNWMDSASAKRGEEWRQERIEEAFDELYVSLPLYLHDHSGITMNTRGFSCGWDSGQVGFVYVGREDAKKAFSWERLTAKRVRHLEVVLRLEVEVYDQYLRGDVYGFIVEQRPEEVYNADGEPLDVDDDELWEHVDSCWGFYGADPHTNGIAEHIGDELHHLLPTR